MKKYFVKLPVYSVPLISRNFVNEKNYFSDYYLNSNVPFGTYFSIETSQQSKSIYFDRFEYSIKDFLSDSSKILHVKLGAFLNNFCMNCAVH